MFTRSCVSAVVCICLVSSLKADAKTDPSGTWRWEYEMQGRTLNDELRLSLDDNGKVVGTFLGQNRTATVEDGKVAGRNLTVAISLDFDGTPVRMVFSGPVTGDSIDGTVTAEFSGVSREYPWKPKRSVKLDDVVGTWDLKIRGADNLFEPRLRISESEGKFKSAYTSHEGAELNVESLEVDDRNNVTFTVRSEYNGAPMKIDYKGRPYGNKISGLVQYKVGDRSGEAPFTGQRKSAVTESAQPR